MPTVKFLILADLLFWCWADLRLRRIALSWPWRILLASFVVTQAAYAMLFAFEVPWVRGTANSAPIWFHVFTYFWHMAALPLFCITLGVYWIARRLIPKRHEIASAGKSENRVRTSLSRTARERAPGLALAVEPVALQVREIGDAVEPQSGISRRRLMVDAFAITLPAMLAGGLGGAAIDQLGRFRIRQVDLAISGLPPDLNGLTVAWVSDLHIGKLTRPGAIDQIARATNAMDADLIIFTGDLIDFDLSDMSAGISFIRQLQPRHGPGHLFMIEGNHDLLQDGHTFERMARAADLPLLIDQARTVEVPGRQTAVQLLGLCWGVPGAPEHDERFHNDDKTIAAAMQRTLPLRDHHAFPILLTHHPHAFDPAADAGLPLTLAGHTHGGQIMLSDHIGGGPLRFRYWTGLYRKKNRQLFVNNGVGNWFPLRVNAPAEIVKLTLRSA